MSMKRRSACLLLASGPAIVAQALRGPAAKAERVWIGPEFWSNPLQDWRLRDGRIECIVSGGDRHVYLLTRELAQRRGTVAMRVRMGRMEDDSAPLSEGFAGFRLGIRGYGDDYRDSAIYGWGLNAGISSDGALFIGKPMRGAPVAPGYPRNVQLALEARPRGDAYEVRLSALDDDGRVLAETTRSDVPAAWLHGGMAIVASSGPIGDSPDPAAITVTMSGLVANRRERHGNVRFWFKDWSVSGTKVDQHDDRTFGPILWTMYTVSRGTLKLSAQMAPVAITAEPVRLQVEQAGGWKTIGAAPIDPLSRTAVFRVAGWDASRDSNVRVTYSLDGEHEWRGTVRKDPVDKEKFVLAGVSCLNDFGFPHRDLVGSLRHHQPDLIAFEGDQIYERSASYGLQRFPLQPAALDYLRKWYLFGWAFRDIVSETPCVCMADDHDVFQGNVWGAGGRHAEGVGMAGQDSGGYVEPAAWVNMMQRTQTSHLPDPFDPTPVEQNIAVYYTNLCWGGVSFAVIEDRKWKSAPKTALPKANIVNGWAQNPEYSARRDGDAPDAQLLGPRQMKFLEEWARDWKGVWMKVALSQTLFANVATLPPPANTDSVVPKLPILKAGQYAEGDMLVADHDSNGWPQSRRNEALRAWRKCAAIHICGDQHLGSTVQYGAEEWGDAAYALCSPALSNIFPRRWYPEHPGENPRSDFPKNTGDYSDGFGNKVTVHATFNPEQAGPEPNPLFDRSPGYGIITMDRASRAIAFAIWPRRVDPAAADARPAPGWPITIHQMDNGWTRAGYVLEELSAGGREDLCAEVKDSSGEIIYTVRFAGKSFAAPVAREGAYTVRVFDPEGEFEQVHRNLIARKRAP